LQYTEVSVGPNHALIASDSERFLTISPTCPQDESDQAWSAALLGHKVIAIDSAPNLAVINDWLGVLIVVVPPVKEWD
jgi:hypothetical protein